MFGFEQLDVWQKAIEYADDVYRVTRAFPADERFGLTNQLRRASVSISSNIAEGSGRGSNRDFSRFLEIAYGSLMETVSQSTVANRQEFCNADEFRKLYSEAERIARMLSGLRNSLNPEG